MKLMPCSTCGAVKLADEGTVTLSIGEYRALLGAAGVGKEPFREHIAARWRIDQSPELAQFVRDNVGKLNLTEMHRAIAQHFAGGWVPGLSTLHRYLVVNFSAATRATPAQRARFTSAGSAT